MAGKGVKHGYDAIGRHPEDRSFAPRSSSSGGAVEISIGCLDQGRCRKSTVTTRTPLTRVTTGEIMQNRHGPGARHLEYCAPPENATAERGSIQVSICRLDECVGAVRRVDCKAVHELEPHL